MSNTGTVRYGTQYISTASEMGKELLKFEQAGYNPKNNPYPTTLFKALKREDGVVKCMDSMPSPYGWINDAQYAKEVTRVESFNRQCQREVPSLEAEKAAYAEGWRDTPNGAMEAHEKLERWIGDEAAKRAHQDRSMSERAQKEIAVAEAATPEHVAEVAVSKPGPKLESLTVASAFVGKKRGRPRKVA